MKMYSLQKRFNKEIIPVSYIINNGKKSFITTDSMRFKLSNNRAYIVEKGFEFDGASAPRFFWWYIPRIDDRILGVILHDHMYVYDFLRGDLTDYDARLWIDKEMLKWCNKSLPKEKIKNKIMYYSVRLFGGKIFKK